MREEEATSQFDSPCISRVCSFTMAEIWLANLTISLEESINHRSNEMATVPSVSQWRRNIKTQVAVAERMERTETHLLLRKERVGDGRRERQRDCDRKRKSRERRGSQKKQSDSGLEQHEDPV